MSPVIVAPMPGQAAPAPAASDKAGAATAAPGRHAKAGRDGAGTWLYVAAVGLFALAGAAAAVSFSAQYRLVYAARHLAVAAGLEAAIPDAAALVFACLGVALALHGRRAIRARLLNMAAAGTSVSMNVIAAAPGWRDLAVWAMPPAAYALASDTLIGVIRTGAIARQRCRRPGAGGHPPGGGRRAGAVAAAAGHGPEVDPGGVPRPGSWRSARSPPAAAPADPTRPGRPSRPSGPAPRAGTGPAPGARRMRRGGGEACGAGRRRPGSWPWSPSGTGRWPRSRWDRWGGSAPASPRRRT